MGAADPRFARRDFAQVLFDLLTVISRRLEILALVQFGHYGGGGLE
jgi:hypothetical protein